MPLDYFVDHFIYDIIFFAHVKHDTCMLKNIINEYSVVLYHLQVLYRLHSKIGYVRLTGNYAVVGIHPRLGCEHLTRDVKSVKVTSVSE